MLGRPLLVFAALLGLAACDPGPTSPAPTTSTPAPSGSAGAPATAKASLGELDLPAPTRLVAIGDVHGDLERARKVLRLAGAIDDAGSWIGGELVVVQVGDQTDRGDDDRAILDLFDRLRDEAPKAGGRFISLNGNHELMNAAGDFRYVTEGGFERFSDVMVPPDPRFDRLPAAQRPRAAAFFPGGPYARKLAEQPVVIKVGESVFVHGGVLQKHVDQGLAELDKKTRAWLRGEGPPPPAAVTGEDGLVWARHYSAQPAARECGELTGVLASLGAKRLVMGHTPQRHGVSEACGGSAWRVDVGLAKHYGGPVQALEITSGGTKVLAD